MPSIHPFAVRDREIVADCDSGMSFDRAGTKHNMTAAEAAYAYWRHRRREIRAERVAKFEAEVARPARPARIAPASASSTPTVRLLRAALDAFAPDQTWSPQEQFFEMELERQGKQP